MIMVIVTIITIMVMSLFLSLGESFGESLGERQDGGAEHARGCCLFIMMMMTMRVMTMMIMIMMTMRVIPFGTSGSKDQTPGLPGSEKCQKYYLLKPPLPKPIAGDTMDAMPPLPPHICPPG